MVLGVLGVCLSVYFIYLFFCPFVLFNVVLVDWYSFGGWFELWDVLRCLVNYFWCIQIVVLIDWLCLCLVRI